MTHGNETARPRTWRTRDLALAACATWLLLQNSLIALWYMQQHFGPALALVRVLIRVGLHLASELWMLPAAALVGVALALSTGERSHGADKDGEVHHVRA